ncbi:MAG: phosphate ABC transporter permease PstA [Zoogloeaceae bacterium]|jgi:phosphate transport system permease protein|nr:phosphate ABC transporter permease PstA [Zoogloeaceae bacterium]
MIFSEFSADSVAEFPASAPESARRARFRFRKWLNASAIFLSLFAMVFGIFWLLWILWDTCRMGLSSFSVAMFTESTPPPNEEIGVGGLANAMMGSLQMVALATLIGAPVGVLSGIYLAEYDPRGKMAVMIRFINDLLLSAPSIIIGLFIYAVMVVRFKEFSGWAGAAALSLIVIPVVIRTTENMLALIPIGLREAAYALGAPKWKVIMRVTLTAARAGVLTGVLLAVARIAGETAPLLFTALNNQFWKAGLSGPTANLPVTILQFAMSPYENWRQLAWGGVFLITLAVLVLNILARILSRGRGTE